MSSVSVHHDGDHYSASRSDYFPPQVVPTTDMMDVTFVSAEAVVCILHGVAHDTPVLTSYQFDALTGTRSSSSVKSSSASVLSNFAGHTTQSPG